MECIKVEYRAINQEFRNVARTSVSEPLSQLSRKTNGI